MKRFTKSLVAGLLLVGVDASAVEIPTHCLKNAVHSSVSVLLVDRTDFLKDPRRFSQMMASLRESVRAGERLVVTSITGRANSARVMVDVVRPAPSAWVSKLKSRKAEKDFEECVTSLEQVIQGESEKHESSSILETLAFISQLLESDPSSDKRVIVYSDMIQNSDEISFYKKKVLNTKLLIAQTKKAGLLRSFPGVRFYYVTNSGSLGERRDREVEAFWKEYTVQSKASFRMYGPALVGE